MIKSILPRPARLVLPRRVKTRVIGRWEQDQGHCPWTPSKAEPVMKIGPEAVGRGG
jgi:hypothetical protein